MKHLITIGLLLLASGFAGCEKEKISLTKKQALTGTNWRLTGFTSSSKPGDQPIDEYAGLDACQKDDVFIYLSDNTMIRLSGAVKCNPGQPELMGKSTWRFSNDEQKIYTGTTEYNLLELTENKLVMESTSIPGASIIFIYSPY